MEGASGALPKQGSFSHASSKPIADLTGLYLAGKFGYTPERALGELARVADPPRARMFMYPSKAPHKRPPLFVSSQHQRRSRTEDPCSREHCRPC